MIFWLASDEAALLLFFWTYSSGREQSAPTEMYPAPASVALSNILAASSSGISLPMYVAIAPTPIGLGSFIPAKSTDNRSSLTNAYHLFGSLELKSFEAIY
jgi:hypothetical protein